MSHQLRESCFTRKKDKKITLSEATQNAAIEKEPEKMPENLPERFSPSEAPEVMRPTAEYLLLKTGRKALTEPELSALRTLAAGHYPARVQKEIDIACDRFKRNGRDLAELNFCYIANALKHQASRPFARASTRKNNAEFKRAMADFNRLEESEKREYTEADIAKLEAELAEEMSKNEF